MALAARDDRNLAIGARDNSSSPPARGQALTLHLSAHGFDRKLILNLNA
jgi:hypothetical protein